MGCMTFGSPCRNCSIRYTRTNLFDLKYACPTQDVVFAGTDTEVYICKKYAGRQADPRGRLVAGVAGSNTTWGMDGRQLCLYVVLSCVGRGLYDGLITRPEESYRVSVCV
jgi:hypothetical protein